VNTKSQGHDRKEGGQSQNRNTKTEATPFYLKRKKEKQGVNKTYGQNHQELHGKEKNREHLTQEEKMERGTGQSRI